MNKLTKLLSVFVIAGAIGTGVAGVAGCTNNNSGSKHSYEYTQIPGNDQKHNVHCITEGHENEADTQQEHTWSGDECSKCHYPKPSGEASGYVIPASAVGILIEGVTAETINLSTTKTSHTIDKNAITVSLVDGNGTKVGSAVPAANVELKLTLGGAAVSSWENIKTDGTYSVVAKVINATIATGSEAQLDDFQDSVAVTISNPIQTNSLAVVTEGATLTQGASVQDKMSSTWSYTVTRANGEVEPYTGTVTVTVDTENEGTNTATLTSGNLTGTVEVTITAATIRKETYAYNSNAQDTGTISADSATATPVELFKSSNGNTKLEVCGAKVEANGNSAAQECDGKYFANRTPLNGATFTSTNTLQQNQRYFILTTEGVGKLTIYWSRNSSDDERGVSVFNSTVTDGDISALTPGATTIAKQTVPAGTAADVRQAVQKMTVNIPAAGTYWITTANNQNVYFYYIELTTEFDGTGNDVALEDGANTLAKMKVSHDKVDEKDYVQQFTVGDTFTVDSGYSVKGTFVTANTAKKSEQTLTENLTYWIGDTQLTPGTTALTADLFDTLGNNTVTVKYNDSAVTGSYTIFVDSAVAGVTGISATVKNTVDPVLADASAKLTLNKTDIDVAIVGENENAQITATTVKYKVKDADDSTAVEITDSVQLGAGEYVILVTATVEDSTASKSADFEATAALKVVVAGNGASWLYQDQTANKTIGSGNTGLEVNDVIDNNGSFTAVALNKAIAGYTKDSTNFETKITDSDWAPVAAADKTASGEAKTFTNALAFDSKPGASGKDYIKITAKKATTIYVYLNASDDKHGSNRIGTAITYTVNGGAATDVTVSSVGRKDVTVVKVTLAAGDELIIGAKQGASSSDPRIWFYGIEAVDVTAE